MTFIYFQVYLKKEQKGELQKINRKYTYFFNL